MSEPASTRRRYLLASSAAVAAVAAPGTAGASRQGWQVAETPVDDALDDVVATAAGVYAVGGGGVVLERTREGWTTAVDDGPTGNGNDLYGAAVTDDGARLWVVGASGTLCEYDVTTGRLTDRSAPRGATSDFNDVAVTGPAGAATVHVAGDSGAVHYSFHDGERGTWESVTPASGATVRAIDFHDDRAGHLVDGTRTVLATRDGATWTDVGVADADHGIHGVDSDGTDGVWVSGGGGTVYHWNGDRWTRADTGDADLRDVEVVGNHGHVVGADGRVYAAEDGRWRRQSTPTGENLAAVVSDPALPVAVAVGTGGTVVER